MKTQKIHETHTLLGITLSTFVLSFVPAFLSLIPSRKTVTSRFVLQAGGGNTFISQALFLKNEPDTKGGLFQPNSPLINDIG